MNYWDEKSEFWTNKTRDNEIYQRQKFELVADIKKLIKEKNITRIIDVGGHKGVVGTMLPDGIEYINLDFRTGIDISKPWNDQKGALTLKKEKGTLVLTSLTLICLSPEGVSNVLDEARKFGDHFYFYEEDFRSGNADGQKINDDFGGKWTYDWKRLFSGWGGKWKFEKSVVNQSWIRISQI